MSSTNLKMNLIEKKERQILCSTISNLNLIEKKETGSFAGVGVHWPVWRLPKENLSPSQVSLATGDN